MGRTGGSLGGEVCLRDDFGSHNGDIGLRIFIIIMSVFLLISSVMLLCEGNKHTENVYSLSPIDDGVYAISYTVYETNDIYYDVVTLCCNGRVKTFKGYVHILFSNENPYAHATEYNKSNSDEVYIYVPQGTVKILDSIGLD